MRRRKKRKREKISKSQPGDVIESEAQAGSEEAAAQDQADDTLTAADELAPLQVTLHTLVYEVFSTYVCSHVTCLSGHP